VNDDKTNDSNIQEMQESLNQETYENLMADDYCNTDKAVEVGAATKKLKKNHQQNKRKTMKSRKKRKNELPRNEF